MASDSNSNSGLEEIVEPFLTVKQVVVTPVTTLSSLFLVYGMYIIVFGLGIRILYRRKESRLGLYIWCTTSLFALATLYVVTEAYGEARQAAIIFRSSRTRDYQLLIDYIKRDNGKTVWGSIINHVTTLMNALADVMLIHRCYILWGSKRVLLYILTFVAVALNGIGLAVSIMVSVKMENPTLVSMYDTAIRMDMGWLIATAVFNAGRIWWISREARRHMGGQVHKKYRAIVAAMLESGALYPAALIASMIIPLIWDPDSEGKVPVDLTVVATLASGLAPTLMIVRIAYGKSVESVQQMVSIHFADRNTQQGSDPGELRATVNIHSILRDESGPESGGDKLEVKTNDSSQMV